MKGPAGPFSVCVLEAPLEGLKVRCYLAFLLRQSHRIAEQAVGLCFGRGYHSRKFLCHRFKWRLQAAHLHFEFDVLARPMIVPSPKIGGVILEARNPSCVQFVDIDFREMAT